MSHSPAYTPASKLRTMAGRIFHSEGKSTSTPHTIKAKASGFLDKLLARTSSAQSKQSKGRKDSTKAAYYEAFLCPAPSVASADPSVCASYLLDKMLDPSIEVLATPASSAQTSLEIKRCRSANALLADIVDGKDLTAFGGSLASTLSADSCDIMPDDLQDLFAGVTASPQSRREHGSDTASFEGAVSTAHAALQRSLSAESRPGSDIGEAHGTNPRTSLSSLRSEAASSWSHYQYERPVCAAERMLNDIDEAVSLAALASAVSPSVSTAFSMRTSMASSVSSADIAARRTSIVSVSSIATAASPIAHARGHQRTSMIRYSSIAQDVGDGFSRRFSADSLSTSSSVASPTPGVRGAKTPMLTATRLPRAAAASRVGVDPSPRWVRPLRGWGGAGKKVERPQLLSSLLLDANALIPPETPPPSSPSDVGGRLSFDSDVRSSFDSGPRRSFDDTRASASAAEQTREPFLRVPLRLSAFHAIDEEPTQPTLMAANPHSTGEPFWREAALAVSQSRSYYPDTDESLQALSEFTTPHDLHAFVTHSKQRYRTLQRPDSARSSWSTPGLTPDSGLGHASQTTLASPASPVAAIAARPVLGALRINTTANREIAKRRQTVYIKSDQLKTLPILLEDDNRAKAIHFATRRLEGKAAPGNEDDSGILEARGSARISAPAKAIARPRPATSLRASRTSGKLASMR